MNKLPPLPPSIEIGRRSTPLQRMNRLSEELGVEVFFKRDDLTGSELSGNKIRKLEFLLADAREQGADTVITCGGAQSNHCRATALAAARCGLKATLLLRTENPAKPPSLEGNILLDRMAGAEIVWITPEQYKRRQEHFEAESARLRKSGRRPYIIPEGGSNHIGAWGYVTAIREIGADLAAAGIADPGGVTILSAVGSGGTIAGLLLGNKILGLGCNVVGVNVCDDEAYFLREIAAICREFSSHYKVDVALTTEDITIIDGYVGRGYALSRREELEAIYELSKLEGVVLDPVYTGKAYYGMRSELKKNRRVFGERIVFVHTGGLFGLFPLADQLSEIF